MAYLFGEFEALARPTGVLRGFLSHGLTDNFAVPVHDQRCVRGCRCAPRLLYRAAKRRFDLPEIGIFDSDAVHGFTPSSIRIGVSHELSYTTQASTNRL